MLAHLAGFYYPGNLNSKQPTEKKPARAYATMDGSCGYDVGKYTGLLLEAAGTMLAPFGYDYQRLVKIAPLSA